MYRRSKEFTISHKNQRIKIEYLYFVFNLCIIAQQYIDRIFNHYVYQLYSSLIVWWWSKNQDFVWCRLKLLLIVEVDRLLMTWKIVDRILLSMWFNFSRWAKKLTDKKALKNKITQVVYKIERLKETPRKNELPKSEIGVKQNKN